MKIFVFVSVLNMPFTISKYNGTLHETYNSFFLIFDKWDENSGMKNEPIANEILEGLTNLK